MATRLIKRFKDLIPKTSYERESLLKAFLLFFVTIEIFLGVITYLIYKRDIINLRNSLYLELKNYSYTFEGEKFDIDIVKNEGQPLYELLEDDKGLYILIPVPGVKEDLLKIVYPREKYEEDISEIFNKNLSFFLIASVVAVFISLSFSLYAINPLREALNIIEEVMRDIIHDINTPIMTVLVNLKILKKKYDDEEIERAILAVKQLQSLREKLRPMIAKAELKLEEVNLKEFIEEEIKDFEKIYPDVKIERSLTDVKVKADREALKRILSNLLENAFKHSNPKSWVRINLKDGELIIENPSKEIKNPKKLFERYYRESQRGIGLGLSIVKKLCSEMGWKIDAEYKDGIFRVKVTLR